MPPRKLKQETVPTDISEAVRSIQEQAAQETTRLKEKLAELRNQKIAEIQQNLCEYVPENILNMQIMEFLTNENCHKFLLQNDDEVVGSSTEQENIVKEEEVENMETDEHRPISSLSQETSIPENMESTPTRVVERIRELRTPLGNMVSVPRVIKPKVDTEMMDAYRKPHHGEEIAFSIDGSPLVIQSSDPQIDRLREVLNNENFNQSPESRQLAENVQKLLRRKMTREGNMEVKAEPGTAV